MFNTYQFPTRDVTKHVHEHRAPTNESVRLLKELENSASDKVISVNRLENNILNATWSVIDSPISMELTVVCRIMLNGNEIRFEKKMERPYRSDDPRKIVRSIIEALSEELVKQLLSTTEVRQHLLR